MPLTAAALQFTPGLLEPDRTRERLARELAACDAGLAVLPELCVSGYNFEHLDEVREVAEHAHSGPTATLLRTIAVERRMAIVAGIAEASDGRFYNSAITVLPDGAVHVYRKTHLFGREPEWFTPGDTGFHPIPWSDAVLGVMICYDWRFPESVRTLALRGAEVICHPSDLVAPPSLWKPVMRTRAVENKVFTITANRTGTEERPSGALTFHGCSQITACNGSILAERGETDEGWITAAIEPARARDKRFSPHNDIFADRRPDLYQR